MDSLYNFLTYISFALVVAAVAVIFTLGRYRKMLESMQQQTDEYFKHAMQVVLKNQQKLTEIIVEEIRNKDGSRADMVAQRLNDDDADAEHVVKFERKSERDR